VKIKYSPCMSKIETQIKCVDDLTIEIDGELFEFSLDYIEYPDIIDQTNGSILEAHVENGELYLTVLYLYQDKDKAIWENDNYYPGGGYRGSQYEDSRQEPAAD